MMKKDLTPRNDDQKFTSRNLTSEKGGTGRCSKNVAACCFVFFYFFLFFLFHNENVIFYYYEIFVSLRESS